MDVNTVKQGILDSNTLRCDEGFTSWEQYRDAVIKEAAMLQAIKPYCGYSSFDSSLDYSGSYKLSSYVGSLQSLGSACGDADFDVTRLGYGLKLI